MVVNVSPGVFHRVSGLGAGEGTKVPTEFGAKHTGSFPCRWMVPSRWLEICLENLAGDNGDGTPGGIGNTIQASKLLASCDSSRVGDRTKLTNTVSRDNTTKSDAVFPIAACIARSVYSY